jgi:hypothetical protein
MDAAFGATAGAYEFFARISAVDGDAELQLVFDDPTDLDGTARDAATLRGSIVAGVLLPTSNTVAAACSPEFNDVCAGFADTPVSGTVMLSLSGGRLTGSLDVQFRTVQMRSDGTFASVVLSAGGDVDLPAAFLQVAE